MGKQCLEYHTRSALYLYSTPNIKATTVSYLTMLCDLRLTLVPNPPSHCAGQYGVVRGYQRCRCVKGLKKRNARAFRFYLVRLGPELLLCTCKELAPAQYRIQYHST